MGRILFSVFFGSVFLSSLSAQNETDALRYSNIGFGGTARYIGMSGAFGAIGADVSVLSTNPAGLGMYHKNEMVFSPSLYSQNVTSLYNGTTSEQSRYNMRFENFGMVFTGKTDNKEEKGWQHVSMGIGYNCYNTFQRDMLMEGDATTSMMDSWKKTAGGTGPSNLDPFYEQLAWNTYLLNNYSNDTTQYTDTIPDGDWLHQIKTTTERGKMGEWNFAVAGNYSNKIYLGASVGIASVRYEYTSEYSEQELYDTVSYFNSFAFDEMVTTTGRGYNFKCGMIYRPLDFIRIGLAFNSPTALKLNDKYSNTMTSAFDQTAPGTKTWTWQSPDGSFSYTIRTPMRTTASAAFIIGKAGMIGADYEIVDYSDAMLKSPTFAFRDANAAIKSKYTLAENLRVGGEFRLLPWIFRAGFAYYGSPYKSTVENNAAKISYSFGFGYRDKDDNFFADIGFVTNREKSNYYFYDQSLVNPVNNKSHVLDAVLTVGFRY
ncbi:MAG: outer membrane protein transport protein [Bacteroidetes bacterium]|nr:outer membrane protein transport protein [Bacteroidota bacterium]